MPRFNHYEKEPIGRDKKLQQLAALQQLSGGTEQAQLQQREQAARVEAAMQMLGLQQRQQEAQAQDAFRQQELAQRGRQFDTTQQADREQRNMQNWSLTDAADRGWQTQQAAQKHQEEQDRQSQENNKRLLQLGVLGEINKASAGGQSPQAILDYAGAIDPQFKAQQEAQYWKRTGQAYDQNVSAFNALPTQDPNVQNAFFTQNQVPPETRQWLLQQMHHAVPTQTATGNGYLEGREGGPLSGVGQALQEYIKGAFPNAERRAQNRAINDADSMNPFNLLFGKKVN